MNKIAAPSATVVQAESAGSSSPAPLGTSKILIAMNKIMARVGYVQKQGVNSFHNYKYAGEGNLLEVLRPAMVEEGLLLIPSHAEKSEIDQHGNVTVLVEYTLAHKDGEVWPEKIRVYGTGNDRAKNGNVGDKGVYKAATGANKYLLFKLFQIETGDDPEKDAEYEKDPAPTKGAQAPEPKKSVPGITAIKTEITKAVRELKACSEGAQLTAYLPSISALCLQVCRDVEDQWIGPEEGSGLRGMITQAADELLVRDKVDKWLSKVEASARQPIAAE